MSATRDLIAAALTAADELDNMTYTLADGWLHPQAEQLRELCARAMVQPDMAEVERLLLHFEKRAPWLRHEQRTALLDYVRNIIAERDAAKMVPAEVPMPEPVTAQHRFRHPQKLMPGWSGWQPCEVQERPAWKIDSVGYEVEYRVLFSPDQMRTYGDAREAAGYAAGITSGAKQMFDYIQFAAANTSDTEWDTRLCELSQDALEAVSPVAHAEWKTIQRAASESRTAGEAAGYARGLAEAGKDAARAARPSPTRR